MGGPGSGRHAQGWHTDDCRVLVISELAAHGRRERLPAGEICWLRDGITRARLSYQISVERAIPPYSDLWTLSLRYQKTMDAAAFCEQVTLFADRPSLAHCPLCGGFARKLYARPYGEHFYCRRCQKLGYRRRAPEPSVPPEIPAAMGSLLAGLYVKPARAHRRIKARRALLASLLKDIDDLRPQERRVYCLRLAKAGYSCREIARLVGTSKSSVQRYLAAGSDAIDRQALVSERLQRYRKTHPLSWQEMRRMSYREALDSQREEMVLTFAEPQDDGPEELPD